MLDFPQLDLLDFPQLDLIHPIQRETVVYRTTMAGCWIFPSWIQSSGYIERALITICLLIDYICLD